VSVSPSLTRGPLAGMRACVFDAYGTLLDVHSAVAAHALRVGPRAAELSALWRRKQLEYSWLRTLMRRYASFTQVTAEALSHAMREIGCENEELRSSLLEAYGELAAYPEVGAVLAGLRGEGLRLAVLSNADPAMLESGLSAAGLVDAFEAVISVDELRLYKPAPEAYLLASRRLGLAPGELAFFSSNGWDVHGAAACGLRAVWVNRSRQAAEGLPFEPAAEIADLTAVKALVR
jgi:2-haloacid dehalogenase